MLYKGNHFDCIIQIFTQLFLLECKKNRRIWNDVPIFGGTIADNHFFFCQNFMSNFRKTIETQKAINQAVEEIFKHFRDVISYAETLETMADAQVELMELMEINRTIAANSEYGLETVPTDDIVNFIHEANQAYRLLRPFAKLMGQVYGNED